MTALSQYQRIEATALWRANEEAQRREVIASIGDATLVISDLQDRALAHWSLPAIVRANPGEFPAIFHPDGDPRETLELSEEELEMVTAIGKLQTAIEKRRPHPGRLRIGFLLASAAAIVGLGVFWLPGTLVEHTTSVVPPVKQSDIGADLLQSVERVAGQRCANEAADQALSRLANRLTAPDALRPKLIVVPGGSPATLSLPGGYVVLNAALFEDHEIPDVVAGYILAEMTRAQTHDPLASLLNHAGAFTSLRLLTTGALPTGALRDYAEFMLREPAQPLSSSALLTAFKTAEVQSTPFAYAVDVSGETTLDLIEGDPFPDAAPAPVMSDGDWIRLQAICE